MFVTHDDSTRGFLQPLFNFIGCSIPMNQKMVFADVFRDQLHGQLPLQEQSPQVQIMIALDKNNLAAGGEDFEENAQFVKELFRGDCTLDHITEHCEDLGPIISLQRLKALQGLISSSHWKKISRMACCPGVAKVKIGNGQEARARKPNGAASIQPDPIYQLKSSFVRQLFDILAEDRRSIDTFCALSTKAWRAKQT
jgi:hypothetical protein